MTIASMWQRMSSAGVTECCAQKADMFGQQAQSPLRQVDREEEAATRNAVATIVRHPGLCPEAMMGFATLSPSYDDCNDHLPAAITAIFG
jgi:hypothetical protein